MSKRTENRRERTHAKCVKCGHVGWLDMGGFCHATVTVDPLDPHPCGCRCVVENVRSEKE